MRKWNWNYLALAAAIAVIAAAFGVYHHYGAETRIAFVNYPEYILAPLLDQEINPAIRADAVKWTETSGKELKDYDCIIFFGMGLNFTEEQSRLLAELKKPVYTTASTRQETALSTLTEEQRETLAGYLAGGKKNFRRMLDFIRYEIDGKRHDLYPSNTKLLAKAKPVYETMPGWKCSTSNAKSLDDLPENARKYLARMAELVDSEIAIISVGPRRDQTFAR